MHIRPGWIWTFLFLITFGVIYSEEPINYESYISIISNKLPEIKINLITLEKASNNYVKSMSAGDTTLSANAEATGGGSGSNSTVAAVDSVFSSLFSIGASRKILDTGTTLSAGISYCQTAIKAHSLTLPQTAFDYSITSPALILSVSQPLLKNGFGIANRYTIMDAKLSREIQEFQTELDNQKTFSSYSTIYFQWIGQLKTLAHLNESLSNAAVSEKQSRAQLAAGLIDNDDYQSTKNLYLQYLSSCMAYEHALKAIATQLGYYFDTASVIPDLKEWDSFLALTIQNNFVPVAFENTKSAQILFLNQKRLEEAAKISQNQILPDLSLYSSLTFAGSGDNGLSAFTNTASKPECSVGLSISFPLENTDAKINLKNSELALQSHNWQWIQAKQNYEIKVKTILDEINTKKKILENTANRLISIRSMYGTQRIHHAQGRITQNTLNDTLIKIAGEEISLIDCQYNLIVLYFDYKSLIY
jgi:outer membrane protein TolC